MLSPRNLVRALFLSFPSRYEGDCHSSNRLEADSFSSIVADRAERLAERTETSPRDELNDELAPYSNARPLVRGCEIHRQAC